MLGRSPWSAALCVLLLGCSTLPDVAVGVCGNHVVEPGAGEDCDDTLPSCGAPDGGAPCRYACHPGATCPKGMACGLDFVCRRPTGCFTFDPTPLGDGQSAFRLADLDGDRYPDLIERGYDRTTLLLNDRHGRFSPIATGAAAPPGFDAIPANHVAVARSPSDPRLLMAILGYDQYVDLFVRGPGETIAPLLWPAVPFQVSGARPLEFRGAVTTSSGGAGALYFDPNPLGGVLVAFDAVGDPLGSPLDPADPACGRGRPARIAAAVTAPAGGATGSMVAFTADDRGPCVAFVTDEKPEWVELAGRAALDGIDLLPPLVADLDGDRRPDVLVATRAGDEVAIWPRDGERHFASPLLIKKPVAPALSAAGMPPVVADFDGDGRDDVAQGADVYLSRALDPKASSGFDHFDRVTPNALIEVIKISGVAPRAVAGDVNRDRVGDIVFGWANLDEIFVCLGGGDGKSFACDVRHGGFAGVSGLALADLDGDGVNDVVAAGLGPLEAADSLPPGGPSGGGLAVFLGRPLTSPDPRPLRVESWHARVDAAARLPPSSRDVGDRLVVALRTTSPACGAGMGCAAFTVSHDHVGGLPIFGAYHTGLVDLRFGDENGDGEPDLALLLKDEVAVHLGGPKGAFFGDANAWKDHALEPLPEEKGIKFPHSTVWFADLPGDSLPSVLWSDAIQGDPGHLTAARFVDGKPCPALGGSIHGYCPQPFGSHVSDPDLLGPVDLDGTGHPAVILAERVRNPADPSNRSDRCRLHALRAAEPEAPASLTPLIDVGLPCYLGPDGGFHGFLADAAPADGRLDLFVWLQDDQGKPRLDLFPAFPDGRFDASVMRAQPVDPQSGDTLFCGTRLAPPGTPDTLRWLATTDLNGDGIQDILFVGAHGLRVALADVAKR